MKLKWNSHTIRCYNEYISTGYDPSETAHWSYIFRIISYLYVIINIILTLLYEKNGGDIILKICQFFHWLEVKKNDPVAMQFLHKYCIVVNYYVIGIKKTIER